MNYYKRILSTGILLLSLSIRISAQTTSLPDSLPYSEINIPVQISLKPIYALAEKNVDTAFSSPNWPHDWITADCATRFKYHFRRTPLKVNGNGNAFNLSFTGLYKVIGSTRACVNGTALSPWTPPCSCGFGEGERKVSIGFNLRFQLQPNYQLKTYITRTNPKPLNKCTVCFWQQDITGIIINNIRKELDVSVKAIQDSLSNINLMPYMLSVWQKLNSTYSFQDLGWLQINPAQLRINSLYARNGMLNISFGLIAKPVIRLDKPPAKYVVLPDLVRGRKTPGFNIYLDALLQYDSLNNIINQRIKDQRFDFTEGKSKKYVIIKNVQLSYLENGFLKLAVDFTGSYKGTGILRGKPVYNSLTKTISLDGLNFDIHTRNALLRTAKWLLSDLIINELKKYTTFNLSPYYEIAKVELNKELNKSWIKGLQTNGSIGNISLISVQPTDKYVMIRSNASGKLNVLVTDLIW